MATIKRAKDSSKVIIGQPPSQMKGNQWYKRGDENISGVQVLTRHMKGATAISFFKVTYPSRGGMRNVEQYWKTMSNGYMVCVDISICKINIVLGMPAVRMIENSTKSAFEKAFKQVLNVLA